MTKNESNDQENLIIAGVTVTHPSKVLYPSDGITKADIAHYYEDVSDLFLKELKNRPLSLVRCPDGIHNGRFFQKHPAENFPEYIDRIKIKEKDDVGTYMTIDALNDVIYLVNLGVIEFHTWNASIPKIEKPDRLVFDLDPAEDVDWKDVKKLALTIKTTLEGLRFKPFLKTSGNKGLHVYCEFDHGLNWEKFKDFAKEVADSISSINPDLYTTEVRMEKRKGKIFIDYLRNERGSTTVAGYSLRTKDTAPLSFPIDWDQIDDFKANTVNIKNYKQYIQTTDIRKQKSD